MGAPVIDEIQLPQDISRGAVGGAGFATVVIVGASGAEQRQSQWQQPKYSWQIDFDARDVTTGASLIAFFIARQGRARGFRFKDWSDFQTTNEPMATTGLPYLQAQKTYISLVSYARAIYKIGRPGDGAVTPTTRKNGSPLSYSAVDYNSGQFLLTPVISKAITAISKASSAIVTVGAAHGFLANDLVYFTGVVGMVEINGLVGTVTSVGATTVTVNINSTGFTTYSSGGLAQKYAATTDAFDWTGEFDIPVRFDQDQMKLTQEDVTIRSWQGISITEIITGNLQALFAPINLTAVAGYG